MTEQLLKTPGFLYEISGNYYYLGKWICKKCTDTEATDCAVMYTMCRAGKEEPDTNMYFQKIRAYADFALEVPYNAAKIREDITTLVNSLSEQELQSLTDQLICFKEDLQKYCG